MSLIYDARWMFIQGIGNTLLITVLAAALALVLAFVVGIARLSRFGPVRAVALVYVEVFRGISLLVQLFWLFFVLPFFGIDLAPITTAVLALGLCNGAYGAEIVRSAIKAVPRGQLEAATALNYSATQRLWKIVVPQAVPAMLPPFGNLMIELMKATSLVSLITIPDLSFQAVTLQASTMHSVEPFLVILCGYFLIAMTITGMFRLLEHRVGVGMERGGIR